MYEPPAIAKVAIIGSFIATPFIFVGAISWMMGNENVAVACASMLAVIVICTAYFGMMAWLQSDLKTAAGNWRGIPSSAEGASMTGEPLTEAYVIAAEALTDEAFMADLRDHVLGNNA